MKVPEAAPSKAGAIIPILEAAAKEHKEDQRYYPIRLTAIEALLKVLEITPREAAAIRQTMADIAKDEDERVRRDAVSALSKVIKVAPSEASTILSVLEDAVNDKR